jgi:hypothetical protein
VECGRMDACMTAGKKTCKGNFERDKLMDAVATLCVFLLVVFVVALWRRAANA